MNDAHVNEMQVQMWKPNTWGVTAYHLEEVLPLERTEARWIARHAKTFVALGDELYKRSPSGVLMKCIPTNQGRQLLLEVHAEICGHHAAPRSLVGKAFR